MNKKTFWLGMVILAAFLLFNPMSINCAQQSGKNPMHMDRFSAMDGNSDGKVTIEEFRSASPNMNEQAFIVIDRNGDKIIDSAEWSEFLDNHGKQPAKMPGARMNNMPGDPMIPPPDSSDLPLMRPQRN